MMTKRETELLTLAEEVVTRAKKRGASAAEASTSDARSTEISIMSGKVEKLERTEAREVRLRVYFGQSTAGISGSALDSAALDRLVERVCEMAKLAPPDQYCGIADKDQLAKSAKNFDQVSKKLLSAEELRELAEKMEGIALAYPGITRSNGAGTSCSDVASAYVTSNGFAKAKSHTACSVGISVVAGEGTAMERDYDSHGAAHFEDVETVEKIATTAAERAVKRLNPRKLSSRAVPIIFDRRVATSLMGHALSGISGASIARGTSFLKDALNTQVFSPKVTIVDDPFRMRSGASRSFDSEGLPTKHRKIFDKGVPHEWLLDLKSARQLKMKPEGQALFNYYMEAGETSIEDMIKSVNQGLLVTEFIGSSINMVTGDYSRGCSGYWIENGEVTYPVSEVTIAGKMQDMFLNLTPASDLIFRSSVSAPSVLVEGMTLAGK